MKRVKNIFFVAVIVLLVCFFKINADYQLIVAIQKNKTADVLYWVNHGANPNAIDLRDPLRPTALLTAIDWRARETPPEFHNRFQGYFPANPAPENLEIVRILVQRGANLEVRNSKGYTPLMIAAWQGKIETVKLLLALGSNINAVSAGSSEQSHREMFEVKGATALSMAIFGRNRQVIGYLLKRGADFKTKFPNSLFSAYELAKERGDWDIVVMMDDSGSDRN